MAFGEIWLRDIAGNPERARWLHLARSGSQSQRSIQVILPAHGASHIIKVVMVCTRKVLSSERPSSSTKGQSCARFTITGYHS